MKYIMDFNSVIYSFKIRGEYISVIYELIPEGWIITVLYLGINISRGLDNVNSNPTLMSARLILTETIESNFNGLFSQFLS